MCGFKRSWEKRVSKDGNVYFAPIKTEYELFKRRGEWMPETNSKQIEEAYNEQKGCDNY